MDQREADEYMKMLAQAIDLKGDGFLGRFVEFVLAYQVSRAVKQIMERMEKQDGR